MKKRIIGIITLFIVIGVIMGGCSSNGKSDSANSDSNEKKAENYPTNEEISFEFIDHTQFNFLLTDGVYRCGTDFNEGDYYIMSICGAEALYDVSDSPDNWSWTYQRVLRKVTVKNGQYVNLPNGAILVSASEVDTNNYNKYGIFLVGRDLPAGEYQISSITDRINNGLLNISGVFGAYQVSNKAPENEPEKCNPLFDRQTYISVKDGQYLTINNAKLVLQK